MPNRVSEWGENDGRRRAKRRLASLSRHRKIGVASFSALMIGSLFLFPNLFPVPPQMRVQIGGAAESLIRTHGLGTTVSTSNAMAAVGPPPAAAAKAAAEAIKGTEGQPEEPVIAVYLKDAPVAATYPAIFSVAQLGCMVDMNASGTVTLDSRNESQNFDVLIGRMIGATTAPGVTVFRRYDNFVVQARRQGEGDPRTSGFTPGEQVASNATPVPVSEGKPHYRCAGIILVDGTPSAGILEVRVPGRAPKAEAVWPGAPIPILAEGAPEYSVREIQREALVIETHKGQQITLPIQTITESVPSKPAVAKPTKVVQP